jgi:hypothetical protein
LMSMGAAWAWGGGASTLLFNGTESTGGGQTRTSSKTKVVALYAAAAPRSQILQGEEGDGHEKRGRGEDGREEKETGFNA